MPSARSTEHDGLPPGRRAPAFLWSPRDPRLLGPDWLAADLHVHTRVSPDVLPVPENEPSALLDRAQRLGLGYVSFTDHMTMDAYDLVGWEREGLIRGVEVSLLDRKNVGHTIHLNVYLATRPQFVEILALCRNSGDLPTLLSFLRANDLPHTYNHPFWFESGERPNLHAIPEVARLVPVLEYNRGRVARLNRLTVELAAKEKKALVACSDCHTGENLGTARTYARGATPRAYLESIRAGRAYFMTSDLTLSDLTRQVNEWIGLIFNGEWREDARTGRGFSIGEPRVDWILNACTRSRLSGSRPLMGTLRRLVSAVSSSGIPQSLYIRSQNAIALEIERQLLAS